MASSITRQIYYGQGHSAFCPSLFTAKASGIGSSYTRQVVGSSSSTAVQAGVQLLLDGTNPTGLYHYYYQYPPVCQEWNTDTLKWQPCPFFGATNWLRVGAIANLFPVSRFYILHSVDNAPKIPKWVPPTKPQGAPPDWVAPPPPMMTINVYGELGLLGLIKPYPNPGDRIIFYPYTGQIGGGTAHITFSGVINESSFGYIAGQAIRGQAPYYTPPMLPENEWDNAVSSMEGVRTISHKILISADSTESDVILQERMRITHNEFGTTSFIICDDGPSCPTLLSSVASPFTNSMLNIIPNSNGMAYIDQYQLFSDIPYPAPYSIRNLIDTPIIIKLRNSAFPINQSSVQLKVNGVDITNKLIITTIPNGLQLEYDIVPNTYAYGNRVYVELLMTQTPAVNLTVARLAPVGNTWLRVSGDTRLVMPNVDIKVGPNTNGQWEITPIWDIRNTYEFRTDPTQYEYHVGDPVYYLNADYSLRVYYWFDIVDDFFDPEIYNISPTNGAIDVEPNTQIIFDMKDIGTGLDFSSFIFLVNGKYVVPEIKQHQDGFYRVTYTPPYPFKYDTVVFCMATITDLSAVQNKVLKVWSFRIRKSEALSILSAEPKQCGFNVHLKDHLLMTLISGEGGIDLSSLILTVDEVSYPFIAWPILYRLK